MGAQFIFTMQRVGRFHPPDRDVLRDITLAFYPGAKIGVLGANGSGKSSLLRIMAGVDDGFTGDARLTDGFTVGLLEQEPTLDATTDVQGNVMGGVGAVAGLLTRYEEVLAGWSDPEADYEKLGSDQAELEKKIEAAGYSDVTVVNQAIGNLTDEYDVIVCHQDLADRAAQRTPSATLVAVDNFMASPRYDEIVTMVGDSRA